MAYLNKIQLIGNLGNAPKIKATQTGRKVANFSIATDDGYFDKSSNNWVSVTTWHAVNAWGPLADKIEKKALPKGAAVYVEGSYRSRKWNDNGTERTIFEVLATDVKFLDRPSNGSSAHTENRSPAERQQGTPANNGDDLWDGVAEEDDLPF